MKDQRGGVLIAILIVVIAIFVVLGILILVFGYGGYSKIEVATVNANSNINVSVINEEASSNQGLEGEIGTLNISGLLDELKNDTGYDYSEIEDITFDWNLETEQEPILVKGKGMTVEDLSSKEVAEIDEFFIVRGYPSDPYNNADGGSASLHGYRYGKTVCAVWLSFEGELATQFDVDIECGNLK